MTQEAIHKELQRIQDMVPRLWRDKVFTEVDKTPTIAFVVDKYLEDGFGTEEERAQVQALKDTGEFSKKRVIENPRFVKLIDDFVTREIKKSVRAGRLPKDASKYKYEPTHP